LVKISIFTAIILIIAAVVYLYFPKLWGEAVYPLAYEDSILKYSKEYNVRPTFIAAVIYTESRYHSDSVSGAGAVGLMQLMPGTARGIAQTLGENFQVSNLYDPDTNIRYGTWYLKDKLDRYNGNTDFVLAAYNGGPAVADRWEESNIAPRGETAGFVNSVKRTESMYVKIYPLLAEGKNPKDINLKRQTPQEPSLWQKIKNGPQGLFVK
jgi:soluble lytic murein transglycosylase